MFKIISYNRYISDGARLGVKWDRNFWPDLRQSSVFQGNKILGCLGHDVRPDGTYVLKKTGLSLFKFGGDLSTVPLQIELVVNDWIDVLVQKEKSDQGGSECVKIKIVSMGPKSSAPGKGPFFLAVKGKVKMLNGSLCSASYRQAQERKKQELRSFGRFLALSAAILLGVLLYNRFKKPHR